LEENFDRFNFDIHKEKEMVDFRRCITALAVLALFAGLAVAQTGTVNPLQCATNVTVTPTLRGEGFTENTGDITLTCTGGAPAVIGSNVPQVNITVFYNTQFTSRLITQSGGGLNNQISEALLLLDEPGSGLSAPVPGFGPAAPQNLCTTPLTGCIEFVSSVAVPLPSPPIQVATDTPQGTTATTPGRNVFQGVANADGRSVTFFGVPILAPGTTASRVIRITNARVNAQPLAGGSASGASPVQASISISGSNSLLITNSTPIVGFVVNGLSASVSGTGAFNQCTSVTKASVNVVRFTENFGTAFKTRVQAQTTAAGAGQGNGTSPPQNVPGTIYNSESNLVVPVSGGTAGLADYGTRLKAVFNGIPAGAHIFVSTANVFNNNLAVTVPAFPGGSGGNTGTVGYAQLVTSETASDAGNALGSFLPLVTATDNGPNNGNVPIAEIPITNGTGTAVWEVVNTNPNTNETFGFGVYITYTSAVSTNSPAAGTSTVTLSYAPTPPAITAPPTTGLAASSSLSIPRFAVGSIASASIFSISLCRTILLYTFVTNQAGFDTGLEISNTSQDPFTTGSNATAAQGGTCALTFYGGTTTAPTTPPAPYVTPNIAGGTVWVDTAQTRVPGFQGYMIAVCNFQYAHGFAFISDVGARNLAMGYLAVVLPDPGAGARTATPMGCAGITGISSEVCNATGEQGAH
jgi:hypothetical protein